MKWPAMIAHSAARRKPDIGCNQTVSQPLPGKIRFGYDRHPSSPLAGWLIAALSVTGSRQTEAMIQHEG